MSENNCSDEYSSPFTLDGVNQAIPSYTCLSHPQSMPTVRRERFVRSQLGWMLLSAFLLAVLDALTYELFFALSFLGFLTIIVFTAPFAVTPHWRRRLKWLIGLGLLGFGYIVVQRIRDILPPGVL